MNDRCLRFQEANGKSWGGSVNELGKRDLAVFLIRLYPLSVDYT